MYLGQQVWSETAAGTDSGAIATHSAITSRQHFVTSVSGHTDADSIIKIKDGTTVVWVAKIDVSAEGFSFSFAIPCIPITPGANVIAAIESSNNDVTSKSFLVNNGGGYSADAVTMTIDSGTNNPAVGDVFTVAGDTVSHIVIAATGGTSVTFAPGLGADVANNAALTFIPSQVNLTGYTI